MDITRFPYLNYVHKGSKKGKGHIPYREQIGTGQGIFDQLI
jgi:hypothetical protein